ncbi:MAG: tRNA dihydrouridine synthase DusB [Hyphomicrobiales bacterium]|nr:tRNA dihydrouridine synthase DusB [Hyphomicrobiales bacterium]
MRLVGGGPAVALAPMSGITDVALRRIAMGFGASYVVSEMVASDEFVRGHEETRLRAEGEGVTPHIVQLAGCDANWLAEAARLAEASGADVIDINMGCPAKRVTGGWAGSALMRDLDHAIALVDATINATTLPVTVKMRLGWDDAARNAPELARRAVGAGAQVITVHGRTRQQFYKGRADWAAIAAVREAIPSTPLVANGDIATAADARACLAASGADGVMIGRAALGRPWLAGLVAAELSTGIVPAEPTLPVKLAATLDHYRGLLALMGHDAGLRHARKHLAAALGDAAAHGAGQARLLKSSICTSADAARVEQLLEEAFLAREESRCAA